jgi:hypothetical protein
MLKFSYYKDDVIDKAWFDSSNIVYAECDESETQYKTVRVVFKNGSTYQYDDVIVSDWVYFKNAESQGKALNERFKKGGYKYIKIDDSDLNKLEEEYAFRSGNGLILEVDKTNLTLSVVDFKECVKYKMDYPGEVITQNIKELLESLNYSVKINQTLND